MPEFDFLMPPLTVIIDTDSFNKQKTIQFSIDHRSPWTVAFSLVSVPFRVVTFRVYALRLVAAYLRSLLATLAAIRLHVRPHAIVVHTTNNHITAPLC